MTTYHVTECSANVVEIEANSWEEAKLIVEEHGSDTFKSVVYEAEVVAVDDEKDNTIWESDPE